MAITVHSATIDISQGTSALDTFLSGTTINTIESVSVVGTMLLILYT